MRRTGKEWGEKKKRPFQDRKQLSRKRAKSSERQEKEDEMKGKGKDL